MSLAWLTAYTVPAGHLVVIKSVNLRNQSGSPQTGYIRLTPTETLNSFSLTASGAAGSQVEWRPWIAVVAGQSIQLMVTNAAGIAIVVSGSIYFV